ncbi:hypothetical protein MSG28_014353 [Choristoneura fumiferana]|uniref:Uncharacterized protein n=1 Tax=Choristoneura fumiferana TaxID=7141 RepID=A0ACC0JGX9_CHOFU|nr:hypothetical protein MSG28_014353 [Choristoneura fumiferana]
MAYENTCGKPFIWEGVLVALYSKNTNLNENRRQWQYPGPARRPQNETTEEPFDPRKDNENFTGTPNVENQCTTKHKLYEITTTMLRVSYSEDCEYNAFYCMRAYDTGIVCGRTIYFHYETFQNYCLLDYVNCMERYDMWQVVHMGKCFTVPNLKDYDQLARKSGKLLDQFTTKRYALLNLHANGSHGAVDVTRSSLPRLNVRIITTWRHPSRVGAHNKEKTQTNTSLDNHRIKTYPMKIGSIGEIVKTPSHTGVQQKSSGQTLNILRHKPATHNW